MWDIKICRMQSKCKVNQMILLASSFADIVYLFYQFNLDEKEKENKMNYRLMFTINAVALALFGGLLTLMPVFVLNQFGSEVYVSTTFVTRFMGGALLMGGLLLWFLRDTPAKIQKSTAFVLLASSIGGFAMSIFGMTSIGVFRTNGWVLLVIFGLFALVYGYMLFLQPKPSESKSRAPRKTTKDSPSANSGQSL
jgi:peptidoglycan/LPS O-acetylase OafA/YrhL